MAKYRKKVLVEAVYWSGLNVSVILEFTGIHESVKDMSFNALHKMILKDGLKIFTKEGPLMAEPGYYILKGIDGEVWPCDGKTFEKTYELVEE